MNSHLGFRLAQAWAFRRNRMPPYLPEPVRNDLQGDGVNAFVRLTPADQRHLIAVHAMLRASHASEDVRLAGLLHDIGKVHDGRHIGFRDRCLKVLMHMLLPRLLDRIASVSDPPLGLGGLWVACNHARLGATAAAKLGYSDRVCWLIEHHEDTHVHDRELAALKAADGSRMAIPN